MYCKGDGYYALSRNLVQCAITQHIMLTRSLPMEDAYMGVLGERGVDCKDINFRLLLSSLFIKAGLRTEKAMQTHHHDKHLGHGR